MGRAPAHDEVGPEAVHRQGRPALRHQPGVEVGERGFPDDEEGVGVGEGNPMRGLVRARGFAGQPGNLARGNGPGEGRARCGPAGISRRENRRARRRAHRRSPPPASRRPSTPRRGAAARRGSGARATRTSPAPSARRTRASSVSAVATRAMRGSARWVRKSPAVFTTMKRRSPTRPSASTAAASTATPRSDLTG